MKVLRDASLVIGAIALAATGVGVAGDLGLLGATTAAQGATAATISTLSTVATVAKVASLAAPGEGLSAPLTKGLQNDCRERLCPAEGRSGVDRLGRGFYDGGGPGRLDQT